MARDPDELLPPEEATLPATLRERVAAWPQSHKIATTGLTVVILGPLIDLALDRLAPNTPLVGLLAVSAIVTVAVLSWGALNPHLMRAALGVLAAFWIGAFLFYRQTPTEDPTLEETLQQTQARLDEARREIDRLSAISVGGVTTGEIAGKMDSMQAKLDTERAARVALQQELDALRAANAPRVITDEAEKLLVESIRTLSDPNSLAIHRASGCQECEPIAHAFHRIFHEAGWNVTESHHPINSPGLSLDSPLERNGEDQAQTIRTMISRITGLQVNYGRHQHNDIVFVLHVGPRE